MKKLIGAAVIFVMLAANSAFAADMTQAQPPGDCEYGIGHQSKSCNQRCDCGGGSCGFTCDPSQRYYGNDLSCARSRVGIPEYSAVTTTFTDTNCGGVACNHAIAGIAHRTFPKGCLVEVCNLDRPDLNCAVAVVMDHGPNVCFPNRMVDGNIKLKKDIGLTGKNRTSYKLLSCPNMTEKAEPSGPAKASLEALLEAQKRGDFAPGSPTETYTSGNTPWGPGFIGTQAGASPFSQTSPMPISNQIQTQYPTVPGQDPYASTSSPATQSSGPPIGMILAQPHTVQSGRNITISWTSAHLSTSQPCQIYINDTQFLGQDNEGTRKTQAGPSSGPEKFTMKCTDQSGNPYVLSDTVTVQ